MCVRMQSQLARRPQRFRYECLRMPQEATVSPSSSCLPSKISRCWHGGSPSFSWSCSLTLSTVSDGSTHSVQVFPLSPLTKICISVAGSRMP
ncbi:hypothetical protein DAI22_10g141900 [Oryza sativa Japonica Group]|nr:hypothetical protein DAI22_10g141900 [Oryza sativa Japonica Group]